MVTPKKWMEMTPKKEVGIFILKCYVCGKAIEVFSDELYKPRKCSLCKELIDPSKCDVIQVH